MKPSLAKETEVQSTNPHRSVGNSVLGWIVTQLRSARQILHSPWSGRQSQYDGSLSTTEITTPAPTISWMHPSTPENAILDSPLTEEDHAEKKRKNAPHSTFQTETPSQQPTSSTSEPTSKLANPKESFEPASSQSHAANLTSIAFHMRERNDRTPTRSTQSEPTALGNVPPPTIQQLGIHVVTREELKLELDTLRRLIENRK
jgi:hypothetical protein